MARDDAVARNLLIGHAEIEAAVGDELVDFLERSAIEQQFHALARRQLAGGVLLFEPLLAAAQLRAAFQIGQGVKWIHIDGIVHEGPDLLP
jgi:hypothetical protein